MVGSLNPPAYGTMTGVRSRFRGWSEESTNFAGLGGPSPDQIADPDTTSINKDCEPARCRLRRAPVPGTPAAPERRAGRRSPSGESAHDNRWAFGGVRPNYPGCGDGRLPASAAHLRRSGPVERRAADRAQEQAERRQVPRRRGGPRCPPGSGGARTRYRGAGVRVRATSRAVPAAAGRARGRPP